MPTKNNKPKQPSQQQPNNRPGTTVKLDGMYATWGEFHGKKTIKLHQDPNPEQWNPNNIQFGRSKAQMIMRAMPLIKALAES